VVEPIGVILRRAVSTLLARAQAAGAVRDDIRIAEVMARLVGTARAAEHAAGDRAVQARTVAIIFDGLRPPHPRSK
jgi:hypothetical protein